MPILKQLVSGSSQTKRRSRLDLTTEMISAPLGDFRHTMHVGRGGDTFGDTSFLSSRSGEPPRAGDITPHSPRPSLLSRTFRSSKRSQSVTRVDRCENLLAPLAGSPTLVKNAFSLPHLNDEGGERGRGVPKSLSSSPVDRPSETDGRPANGVAALDPEQVERSFGELTALPSSSAPRGGAMRRTESVLSFHVDLGPSMLGDILDVMEKEEDSLGGEEGGASPPHNAQDEEGGASLPHNAQDEEGGASPPHNAQDEEGGASPPHNAQDEEGGASPPHNDQVKEGGVSPLLNTQDEGEEEEDNKEEHNKEEDNGEEDNKEEEIEENGEEEEEGDSQEPIVQPPITENMENTIKGPCTPETQPTHPENHHLDTPPEEIPPNQLQGGEMDCTKCSPTQGEEECFSFMEEEDDEIRV